MSLVLLNLDCAKMMRILRNVLSEECVDIGSRLPLGSVVGKRLLVDRILGPAKLDLRLLVVPLTISGGRDGRL